MPRDEYVEAFRPDGTVYVFRPVLGLVTRDYTLAGHLAMVAAAAEGLTDAMLDTRQVYESTQVGVSGARPMTAEERATHEAALRRKVATAQAELDALLAGVG